MITTRALAMGLSVLMFVLIVELVRREKLTFKYAAAWFLVPLAGFFLALFNRVVYAAAGFLGFELPSNFIFFSILSCFVFLGLLLTIFLCQQNNRNDIIAQKLGILENEIERLKKRLDG